MVVHHPHTTNQKIALLIAVLAAALALSEILGKNAQTIALDQSIEASNLWSFFQAKTIRKTNVLGNLQTMEAIASLSKANPASVQKIQETIAAMKVEAEHYETEPETGEGRRELSARAAVAEGKSNKAMAAYHAFEFATAAFEIAIVLTSAAILTEVMLLVWFAGGMGVVGVGLCLMGTFAPMMLHL